MITVIIVLMGVTGSGKTTIGERLAAELGWEFHDADDLHPAGNVAKMRRGVPLAETDRRPWLNAVAGLLRRLESQGKDAVVACSALRARYRRLLSADSSQMRIVYLHATLETLEDRLEYRTGHFMHPGLLPSQLETLEPPYDAVWIDAAREPEAIVSDIRRELGI